jgi:hypothetical protein
MLYEDLTNLRAGKNPKFTQPDLDLSHEDFIMETSGNLGRFCTFEEKSERFDQVCPRLFDRRALARDIELRTQRYKEFVLPFDDRGQALLMCYDPSL